MSKRLDFVVVFHVLFLTPLIESKYKKKNKERENYEINIY